MPWDPSTAISRATTMSIGTAVLASAPWSSPTCTWRPRGRRPAIAAATTAAWPRASIDTCAPPPVRSRTVIATSMPTPASTRASAPRSSAAASADVLMSTATTRAPSAFCDHHRRQPDPTTAVHGHPLAGPHGPVGDDGPVRRREAAAERGRGHERQVVGQRDHVASARGRATCSANEPGIGEPRAAPGRGRPARRPRDSARRCRNPARTAPSPGHRPATGARRARPRGRCRRGRGQGCGAAALPRDRATRASRTGTPPSLRRRARRRRPGRAGPAPPPRRGRRRRRRRQRLSPGQRRSGQPAAAHVMHRRAAGRASRRADAMGARAARTPRSCRR